MYFIYNIAMTQKEIKSPHHFFIIMRKSVKSLHCAALFITGNDNKKWSKGYNVKVEKEKAKKEKKRKEKMQYFWLQKRIMIYFFKEFQYIFRYLVKTTWLLRKKTNFFDEMQKFCVFKQRTVILNLLTLWVAMAAIVSVASFEYLFRR